MTQSEAINELASALSKAQGEMQTAIKDKVNPFFKSAYADLGSVWDVCRPVLCKYGLCIMQTTELKDGQSILVTTLAHSSGQWIKSYLPLNPAKNDSQGMGAAITYLRRYSLSAIMGVVADDDDDGNKDAEMRKETISKDQLSKLRMLSEQLDGETLNGFLDWIEKTYKAKTLNELPVSAYEKCSAHLQAKVKYLKDKEKQ